MYKNFFNVWRQKRSLANRSAPPARLVREIAALLKQVGQIDDVYTRVLKFCNLSASDQEKALTGMYILLEHLLSDLKVANREALYRLIHSRYPALLKLPYFRIVFEPFNVQKLLFGKYLLCLILKQAMRTSGLKKESFLFSTLECLNKFSLSDDKNTSRIHFPLQGKNIPLEQHADWIDLFAGIADELYVYLKLKLGKKVASRIFRKGYLELAEQFVLLETFPVVIEMLPEELLRHARQDLLERQQMRQIVMDKVIKIKEWNRKFSFRKRILEKRSQKLHRKKKQLKKIFAGDALQQLLVNEMLKTEISGQLQRVEEIVPGDSRELSGIPDSTKMGIVITDGDGNIRMFNAAAARCLRELQRNIQENAFKIPEQGNGFKIVECCNGRPCLLLKTEAPIKSNNNNGLLVSTEEIKHYLKQNGNVLYNASGEVAGKIWLLRDGLSKV